MKTIRLLEILKFNRTVIEADLKVKMIILGIYLVIFTAIGISEFRVKKRKKMYIEQGFNSMIAESFARSKYKERKK